MANAGSTLISKETHPVPKFKLDSTPIAPGWLLINGLLLNTEGMISAKPKPGDSSRTIITFVGGDMLELGVGLRMFAVVLNDALLTAKLATPEQAMVNDLRAELSTLKSKNEGQNDEQSNGSK